MSGAQSRFVACGFATTIPPIREMPTVLTACVLDRHEQRVRLSHIETVDAQEFQDLVDEGWATRLEEEEVLKNGCYYAAEGDGAPSYVGMDVAAARLVVFADRMESAGNIAQSNGDLDAALEAYALAAATVQTERLYTKMLDLPMSESRRRRISDSILLLQQRRANP